MGVCVCVHQTFLYDSYKNVNKAHIISAILRYKNGSVCEAHALLRTCNLKMRSFKEIKCAHIHMHL